MRSSFVHNLFRPAVQTPLFRVVQMLNKEEQHREALCWLLAEVSRTARMATKLADGDSLKWPLINWTTLGSRLKKFKDSGEGQYVSGNEKRSALLQYEKANLLDEI